MVMNSILAIKSKSTDKQARQTFKISSKPLIFVLASPSAAGKTTLCYAAVKRDKNIWYSVSATTRAKRPNEKNGREYFFLTKEEFNEKLKNGEFLEHTKIYNAHYATPKQPILAKLESGKDIILDLDLNGVKALKKFYPATVGIYVIPPSLAVLWKRLQNRQKSDTDKINLRYGKAIQEIKNVVDMLLKYRRKSIVDYIIVNNKLDKAIDDLMAIIYAERMSVHHLLLSEIIHCL